MDRDKAIIEEAHRRANISVKEGDDFWSMVSYALELDRSGWQPAAPDVLVVREVLAAHFSSGTGSCEAHARLLRSGKYDDTEDFKAALAAYKKHKGGENAAD